MTSWRREPLALYHFVIVFWLRLRLSFIHVLFVSSSHDK